MFQWERSRARAPPTFKGREEEGPAGEPQRRWPKSYSGNQGVLHPETPRAERVLKRRERSKALGAAKKPRKINTVVFNSSQRFMTSFKTIAPPPPHQGRLSDLLFLTVTPLKCYHRSISAYVLRSFGGPQAIVTPKNLLAPQEPTLTPSWATSPH